jgi:hypothetical protein
LPGTSTWSAAPAATSGRPVTFPVRSITSTSGKRWHTWSATRCARLATRAEGFRWSSAGARLGKTPAPGFLDLTLWREAFTPAQWASVLASDDRETEFGEHLAEAAIRGRPLGNEEFLVKLERQAGRRLRAKPVGRPKQIHQNNDMQMELEIGI